jgi:hypothetical protein
MKHEAASTSEAKAFLRKEDLNWQLNPFSSTISLLPKSTKSKTVPKFSMPVFSIYCQTIVNTSEKIYKLKSKAFM